jgi:hypothetical protein
LGFSFSFRVALERVKGMTLNRSKTVLAAAALALVLAVPGAALSSGGGRGGGGGGGGGSKDLPSLTSTLYAVCADDPDAGGQAQATPGVGGDGQTFTMQIDGVISTNQVAVYLNGAFLGLVDIDAYGDGGSLYTIGYYGPSPVTVPVIHAGDELDVYDAYDGTLLAYGTFG